MSGVGGIVGTSKVLLIASTAGLLAVALLLSSFTTVTRVGGSLSLLWVNLGPSHSVGKEEDWLCGFLFFVVTSITADAQQLGRVGRRKGEEFTRRKNC